MIDKARKNLKDLKSIFLYWYEMFGSNDKSKDMMKAFMKDLAFAKDKNEMIKAQDNELVKEFMQEVNYPTAKAIGLFLASSLHN